MPAMTATAIATTVAAAIGVAVMPAAVVMMMVVWAVGGIVIARPRKESAAAGVAPAFAPR